MNYLNVRAIRSLMILGLFLSLVGPGIIAFCFGPTMYVVSFIITAFMAEFMLHHIGEMATVRRVAPKLAKIYRGSHLIAITGFFLVWLVRSLIGEFPYWPIIVAVVVHLALSYGHKLPVLFRVKEDPTQDGYRSVRD